MAGTAERKAGNLVGACRSFARAVELTPAWGMARLELAQCLRLTGDPNGDAGTHLQAAKAELQDRSVYWIEAARLLEDAAQPGEAAEAYGRSLRLFPAEVRASTGLALTGSDATAIDRLRALAERQPSNLRAWSRLADLAEGAGRVEEAERALRQIVSLSGDRTRAAARFGRFGERVGRPALAAEARRILATSR
jgi:predicted Zn-dependent protease